MIGIWRVNLIQSFFHLSQFVGTFGIYLPCFSAHYKLTINISRLSFLINFLEFIHLELFFEAEIRDHWFGIYSPRSCFLKLKFVINYLELIRLNRFFKLKFVINLEFIHLKLFSEAETRDYWLGIYAP